MLKKLLAFIRLSRLYFLGGGFMLFALGALIARYEGYPLNWSTYVLGQLYVTSLQLMTHYLNEYWDVETDRLNQTRTPFSGGSGVVAAGGISREAVFTAALVCLAFATGALIWLLIEYGPTPAALAVMVLMFLGAFFYSSPPLALAGTGYGEITASITVAGLVPALGHVLQAGRPSPLLLLATAPLVVLHFAMLMAFEFPDFLSDEAAGKRTLLVRLGRRVGAQVHNAALVLAIALAVLGTFAGLPARAALGAVLAAPMVLLQISQVRRMLRGDPISFNRLTFLGLVIFALTTYFTAFTFWVLGA
jgi:1,4-dihydroxy-2-naphthoate polyprenyltransferase